MPLLQKELTALETDVDMVVMLCTGTFPTLKYSVPIIYPDQVLVNMFQALNFEKNIGFVIPLVEQRNSILKKWQVIKNNKIIQVCSPYDNPDALDLDKIHFNKSEVSFIVLDCMGHSESHKKQLKDYYGIPVVLSRELVANYVKSLFF